MGATSRSSAGRRARASARGSKTASPTTAGAAGGVAPSAEVGDVESWNGELLGKAEEDFDRPHYKKGLTIRELWAEERRHLSPLPERPFVVERQEKGRADGER